MTRRTKAKIGLAAIPSLMAIGGWLAPEAGAHTGHVSVNGVCAVDPANPQLGTPASIFYRWTDLTLTESVPGGTAIVAWNGAPPMTVPGDYHDTGVLTSTNPDASVTVQWTWPDGVVFRESDTFHATGNCVLPTTTTEATTSSVTPTTRVTTPSMPPSTTTTSAPRTTSPATSSTPSTNSSVGATSVQPVSSSSSAASAAIVSLPATGASDSNAPFIAAALGLIFVGGAFVYVARRRA